MHVESKNDSTTTFPRRLWSATTRPRVESSANTGASAGFNRVNPRRAAVEAGSCPSPGPPVCFCAGATVVTSPGGSVPAVIAVGLPTGPPKKWSNTTPPRPRMAKTTTPITTALRGIGGATCANFEALSSPFDPATS